MEATSLSWTGSALCSAALPSTPLHSEHPSLPSANQLRSFFEALTRLGRFQVREGRLAFRGRDDQGRPIYQQKRIDLLLGLDFALLAGKHQITHAALIAGDSDFIPAIEIAKQEGIVVYLFHGPHRNIKGDSTYAQELWLAADERIELTQAFMNRVGR